MASFHLRPVSDNSPSPSPSTSTTPPGDHSPPFKGPTSGMLPSSSASSPTATRSRRPLSPSSLRDVDLTHVPDAPLRKYPAPPTGHDLMAMFPPAPPELIPEMRPGPTSGFFQRQERAFFAQAGKEIVRVRVEVDLPETDPTLAKPRRETSAPRSWPPPGQIPASTSLQSPTQSSATPVLYPHPNSRQSPRGPVPLTTAPLLPVAPHSSSQPPPNLHPTGLHHPTVGLRTPPHEPSHPGGSNPKPEFQLDEYRDDPDEAWRRPMPYNERRRAGKHTRRVIVRN